MKMSTYKIPNHVIKYKEGQLLEIPEDTDRVTFEPNEGELIEVTHWVTYPSYDYIFGVPAKNSPRAKKESGFFAFRDSRTESADIGMYLDDGEVADFFNGAKSIYEKIRAK
jgi:hypothetical protein